MTSDMCSRKLALLCFLTFVLISASCGSGGGGGGGGGDGGTAMPGRNDPDFGGRGNILAADRPTDNSPVVEMWIGFDSAERWEHFLALQSFPDGAPYVGGRIVVDPTRELGFYFDPATTFAAEVLAGGFVTTLRALSLDPGRAAGAGHPWAVAIHVEGIVPAEGR